MPTKELFLIIRMYMMNRNNPRQEKKVQQCPL